MSRNRILRTSVWGPRNSVIAGLRGTLTEDQWLADTSEWIVFGPWTPWRDLHELWVDKIHDYVGGE